MQKSIREFAAICAEHLPISAPVFEFGALQVTGSEDEDLRPLFSGLEYVGADMRAGRGVDRILDLHAIELPDESAGCVLCLDTLEHVEYPRKAVDEMHRILRPDGILILSSVFEFPIHGYPDDYWRFTPSGFRSLLKPFAKHHVSCFGRSEDRPQCVVAVAFKGLVPPLGDFLSRCEMWSLWNSAILRELHKRATGD